MKKNILLLATFLFSLMAYAQSDEAKIKGLVEKTENAMGGQKAFDDLNNISWNFFNARTLTWNKKTGDVRIDHRKENTVFLYNTETKAGRVLKNGVEYTQEDSLSKYLNQAYEQWVNDSYWLAMPFKLDDPGVTLKYAGKKKSNASEDCDVLEMTFSQVGVTPQNKYHVYIDEKTGLVCQWDYFKNASDTEPRFSTPWLNYKTYGDVKLSGDRGERKITDIHVFKYLEPSIYSDFKRPSFIK
ncbi:DUF6503 family protein [uncultured Arcticibacterium sp.]|uniref:DUF6503 family protein n=1 Tax=uncultured Arcticibacterium sp. TaxID=2173042 RepID=UPI0030F96309